jgi:short-subunit dehydrogenase
MLYGIDVIVVAPGSVATPIWDKAQAADLGPYHTSDYADAMQACRNYMIQEGRKGLAPSEIGEVVFKALTSRRPKIRYAVVPGAFRNWILPRLLPKKLVDRIIARATGLLPD